MFLIIVFILGAVVLKDIIVDQLPDFVLEKFNKKCQFKSV